MNKELTPEENQVVNLLLFGCETEATIAHVLDTSVGDIEDRLLSIRAKWAANSIEEIRDRASQKGYKFSNPKITTRRITLDDLQFFNKFLGDQTLLALTGTREEKEKGMGIPWKDIKWGISIANLIASGQIEEFTRKRYERMILRLCDNQTVRDEFSFMANKNQFNFRAN